MFFRRNSLYPVNNSVSNVLEKDYNLFAFQRSGENPVTEVLRLPSSSDIVGIEGCQLSTLFHVSSNLNREKRCEWLG